MNNSRAIIIIISMLMFFIALVVKLVDVQIINSEEFTFNAQRQQTGVEKISADRGLIYDRNNVLLVFNRPDISFYADLTMLKKKDKDKIAAIFSQKFNKSKSHYLNLMKGNKKTICIEKGIPAEIASSLMNIKREGFKYKAEPTRVFQYNNLASHLLGYMDGDNRGVMGISEYFASTLKGEDGSRIVQVNAIGGVVTVDDENMTPAIAGNNLYLTIDKSYQLILEEELRKGLKDYGAVSGTGIMMNPNTGEVLALTNIDDYNPNEYWKYNDFQRRNRAITDTYEPGSTLKSFTIASLLDQNLCTLNEKLFLENGTYKYQNVKIKDTHPLKNLNVSGIVEQSSNIGIVKLVQRIENEKFYKYLRGFGFGNTTSITLPGETAGRLRKPDKWSKISKAYLSFGYEISVTPLQLATAYCALINGGVLYEPQLVKKQTNGDGVLVSESSPKEIRRVISKETSDKMREVLAGVVKNGTGKQAYSDLISIGGKTGTSQKLIDGNYSKEQYNSSFVGFFPVDDPQVVCLILVNSPDLGKYGGLVAAPIFKNIAERTVQTDIDRFHNYLNQDLKKNEKFAGDVYERDVNIEFNPKQKKYSEVRLSPDNRMPDLINLQVKDAIYALTHIGLKYKIIGTGIIISQSIDAGNILKGNEVCILKCSEFYIKSASQN